VLQNLLDRSSISSYILASLTLVDRCSLPLAEFNLTLRGRPRCVRPAVAEMAHAGAGTVWGMEGFVAYDNMADQNRLPTYLAHWLDGKLELVWSREIATKPCVYPIDWGSVWKSSEA
jgi:hypothetical protein